MFQLQLPHQTLNCFVVYQSARVAKSCGDSPVAVATLVVLKNGIDLSFEQAMLVCHLQRFLLVVKGAARQAGRLKQTFQGVMLP